MKNRLRELREGRNLHQIDVSKATGIDQRTLSNYETGKTNPDSYALIKLSDFFNVSIDYLLFHDNSSKLSKSEYDEAINNVIIELENIKAMFRG